MALEKLFPPFFSGPMSHSLVTPSILKRQSTFPISYDYEDIEEEPGRLPPIKERKKRDERAAQGYLSTAGDLVRKLIFFIHFPPFPALSPDETISQRNVALPKSFLWKTQHFSCQKKY